MGIDPSFATRAIHGGLGPDPITGAILTPIYQATTFVQPAPGELTGGYSYSRSANPTVSALERNLAALEGAAHAQAFATGMAALTALLLATVRAGDEVVCSEVVYGGTVRLLRQVLAPLGIVTRFVDPTDPGALAAAVGPRTRLVLIESPGNPTLQLVDIAAAARVARAAGALLAVDNTFLTAVLQQPLALGADVSVYSTTKYIEGHNSTVGGALVTDDPALAERIAFIRNATGGIQSPLEAWLTLRGIKTLPLRLARHGASALAIARFLSEHPAVARVSYPGLAGHPQHALARRQQSGFGGMLAFELRGGVPAALALLKALRLIALAENLGAAESLITHPVSMTHADVPEPQRRRVGIGDGLLRLSVGLEDPAALTGDLEQALTAAARVAGEVISV